MSGAGTQRANLRVEQSRSQSRATRRLVQGSQLTCYGLSWRHGAMHWAGGPAAENARNKDRGNSGALFFFMCDLELLLKWVGHLPL
jgi:hypothetical protein